MELQQIQSILGIVLSIVAIIGLPLGVYKFYVKDQQTDGEKTDKMKDKTSELSSQIALLESNLKGAIRVFEEKIGGELKNLTTEFNFIKLNHLHTIEENQKNTSAQTDRNTIAIEKLVTIIDERVPRKTVDTVT